MRICPDDQLPDERRLPTPNDKPTPELSLQVQAEPWKKGPGYARGCVGGR